MTAEEVAATFGITLAMVSARDFFGLIIRLALGCLGERGFLTGCAGLSAGMTTGQDRSTGHGADDFRWTLPALHLVLVLAGGQLAGDFGSANNCRWILLLVALRVLQDMATLEQE